MCYKAESMIIFNLSQEGVRIDMNKTTVKSLLENQSFKEWIQIENRKQTTYFATKTTIKYFFTKQPAWLLLFKHHQYRIALVPIKHNHGSLAEAIDSVQQQQETVLNILSIQEIIKNKTILKIQPFSGRDLTLDLYYEPKCALWKLLLQQVLVKAEYDRLVNDPLIEGLIELPGCLQEFLEHVEMTKFLDDEDQKYPLEVKIQTLKMMGECSGSKVNLIKSIIDKMTTPELIKERTKKEKLKTRLCQVVQVLKQEVNKLERLPDETSLNSSLFLPAGSNIKQLEQELQHIKQSEAQLIAKNEELEDQKKILQIQRETIQNENQRLKRQREKDGQTIQKIGRQKSKLEEQLDSIKTQYCRLKEQLNIRSPRQ